MKRLFILFVAIFIAVLSWFYLNKFLSKSDFIINFPNDTTGLSVNIYHAKPGEENLQIDESSLVASNISQNTTLKLPKGTYRIISNQNDDYDKIDQKIYLGDKPYTLDINGVYTENKLNNLLVSEKQSILNSLHQGLPSVDRYFVISEGKLFEQGNWYGTTLVSKSTDSSNNDTLRVVLRKQDTRWIVVTNPPQILISKTNSPDTPSNVIKDTNNM